MFNNHSIKACRERAISVLSSITDTPHLEADLLIAHVLKTKRHFLYMHPDTILSSSEIAKLHDCFMRRRKREPIAYILGEKEFWSLPLAVNQDVLVPRPETEILVETILKVSADKKTLNIADLGTGSGAIALALAHELKNKAQMVATDISKEAIDVARYNAKNLNLSHISFYRGDWYSALPPLLFDVIVSNPPYIATYEWQDYHQDLAYEPYRALVSGIDGLDAIRTLIYHAKAHLAPGGCLFIEHGCTQAIAVRQLFYHAAALNCHTVKDHAEQDRITWGRWEAISS